MQPINIRLIMLCRFHKFLISSNSQRCRSIHTWRKFIRWQDTVIEHDKIEKLEMSNRIYSGDSTGMYIKPDNPKITFKTDDEDKTREESGAMAFDTLANHAMMRTLDHSWDAIKRYQRYKLLQGYQYDQRFLAERHLFLGPDLAAAHFIVHRDGAVKFVGENVWYKKDEKGNYFLPGKKIPGLKVEAIDASDTKLVFEGMENFMLLRNLRLLSLRNCRYVNDWCLGRLHQFQNSLEYLDLSDCQHISARGLNGLSVLKQLRYVRLDGLEEKKDIAKAAILLEQANPNLQVLGLDYKIAIENVQNEMELMHHPRTVVDAKNNVHIRDECGDFHYVLGNVNEKSVVDDDDLPIVMSTIRKDPPELPLEELEELDELSHGKLRHLLVGSPSGLSWTQESERVLEFETKKLLKAKADIHPFLVPAKLKDRVERLQIEQKNKEGKRLLEEKTHFEGVS